MPGVTRIRQRFAPSARARSSSSSESSTISAPASADRSQQLVLLVVPVDHEPVAGDAGTPRELELADGRDVRAEPLLGEELQHRHRRKRLRAVDDERAGGRRGVRASLGVERRLVVDDDRRPELAGELRRAHAAEHELAVLDAGGVGKQFAEGAVGQWLHAKPIVTLRAVNLLLT